MKSTTLKALTATTGNRKDTWNTPVEFVSDVVKFFGGSVDLDPCSDNAENGNIPARKVYTEEENGLAHEWIADSVFMNHPYSNSKEWVPYATQQYECGNAKEMVLLIKLDVSTKWWNAVAKYPWIAVKKRLRFGTAASAAPFQSAIIYLGSDCERFKEVFGKYGYVYVTAV